MSRQTAGRLSGASQIVVATAIGGGSGYLLTVLVATRLGSAVYAGFGVFWSLLFFAIAVLGGVQQEFARATSPRPADVEPSTARRVVLICGAVVLVVVASTAPAWTGVVLDGRLVVAIPVAVGLLGYLVTATLVGLLYGLSRWRTVAVMIAADGLLRLLLTGAVALVDPDPALLAWCVALPFAIVPAVVWAIVRRGVAGAYVLDAPTGRILRHIGATVAGSAAMGVLISGFSAALALSSPTVGGRTIGAVVFAINLARAPLVIVVLSLQSFLIVAFRDSAGWVRQARLTVVGVLAVGVILALLAWAVGPWVLDLFGRGFRLSGPLLAVIVGSGGLVGALCVTGAAALARSRHALFVIGWATAAAVTVVILALPLDFDTRLVLALLAPVTGLVVHAVGLAQSAARSSSG